MVVFALEI